MANKKTGKPKTSKVNEPSVAYGGKRIHFFNSIEEQENDNYKWLATLTPEENLKYATELIKRVFAKELKNYPSESNHITSDK